MDEACPLPPRYPHVMTLRTCPYRSGTEGKAICLIATPGRYTYDDLAEALGTTYVHRECPPTAEEVAALFGIGKQRGLVIEKEAIAKIRRAIADRDDLPPEVNEAARWLHEAMPNDVEDAIAWEEGRDGTCADDEKG